MVDDTSRCLEVLHAEFNDAPTEIKADKQTNRQTNRHTNRHTNRQTDKPTMRFISIDISVYPSFSDLGIYPSGTKHNIRDTWR